MNLLLRQLLYEAAAIFSDQLCCGVVFLTYLCSIAFKVVEKI